MSATDDDKYLMDTDRNNWAPRLGFAWQATPERLVVRGGFGVFYSMEDMRGSEGIIALNPPSLIAGQLWSAPGPTRRSDCRTRSRRTCLTNYNPSTVSVKARAHDQQAATVYQWNVASEVLLPWESTFELAYVGNAGRNLLTIVPVNTVEFGQDGSVAANRPYPGMAADRQHHHAGRVELPRPAGEVREAALARTLRLASYTYSRAERRDRRLGRRRRTACRST